ncbi:MAG: CDP-alcohol phosphatidyltransferase family protein [Planctomycetota bacterium]
MGYQVNDRRPIRSRKLGVFKTAATTLANAGVSANAISIFGMVAACAAGGLLATTVHVETVWQRACFCGAALLVQARLLSNLLDGMVAVESGTASATGELYNEVPDRVSDTAVLVGFGYAAGALWLGALAALAAISTAYIRALGKAAGLPSDFRGPMAKQQRMFLVTLVALSAVVAPGFVGAYALAWWVCLLIAVASAATSVRRLAGIAKGLQAMAASEASDD